MHKQVIIEQTQALLEEWKHPDPYRPPTAPGGSKYERNLPAPILDRKLLLHVGTTTVADILTAPPKMSL